MSKTNPGFARTTGRAFTINTVASAGSVVGLFAGLAIVGTVIDKFTDKKKD